jgi:glutathione S-transferase
MLTLYYAPSTCALASHLSLEHAGANFNVTRIDFAKAEQRSPEYLKINQKGRVPSLITDHGVLTETPAILQYIAQLHPQSKLAPLDNLYQHAQMNAFNSYLCSTVHVAHAHRVRGERWADDPAAWESMKRKVPETVGNAFALIENEYLRGPWVLGEQFSASDYYLLTVARWLEGDGADLSRIPRVMDHRARMLALPLVKKVINEEEGAR